MTSASRPTKSFLLLWRLKGRSKWDYVVKAWFNGDRELAKSGSLDAARYNVMEGTRTDLNLDDWEVYIEALAAEEEDDDGFLEFLFKMAEFSETRYGGNYESHDMYATRADYEEAIRDYGHPSEAKHLTRCLNAVEKVKSLSDRARTHKLGADLGERGLTLLLRMWQSGSGRIGSWQPG